MHAPPLWFYRLVLRLLSGSPDVLRLFATQPFADAAPRFVRAVMYDYRMTDLKTRRETGAYWRRERC